MIFDGGLSIAAHFHDIDHVEYGCMQDGERADLAPVVEVAEVDGVACIDEGGLAGIFAIAQAIADVFAEGIELDAIDPMRAAAISGVELMSFVVGQARATGESFCEHCNLVTANEHLCVVLVLAFEEVELASAVPDLGTTSNSHEAFEAQIIPFFIARVGLRGEEAEHAGHAVNQAACETEMGVKPFNLPGDLLACPLGELAASVELRPVEVAAILGLAGGLETTAHEKEGAGETVINRSGIARLKCDRAGLLTLGLLT